MGPRVLASIKPLLRLFLEKLYYCPFSLYSDSECEINIRFNVLVK